MSESVVVHPPAPAVEGSTHGGFAEIARQVNARHPERDPLVSRQLVDRWYKCREVNGFPERQPVEVGGRMKLLFDLGAVEEWHESWLERRRAEIAEAARARTAPAPAEYDPTLGTIPLFDLPVHGHPADGELSMSRGRSEVRESSYRSSVLDL